tara:strand:- start:5394 stop:6044 length:651 start_codon:yes stop_codon:yes gene_type:complete
MKLQLLITLNLFLINNLFSADFNITRLKYSGGGDWYSDPSSIPNLLEFVENETEIKTGENEIRASIGDSYFYNNSYYYITGHGNINFNDSEKDILRQVLLKGGFLHADDNYGMDKSFRKEMKEIFPDKKWVQLPPNHEIFHILFKFPNGLPKIHEHDGESPQALALFHNNKIIVLYTYQSDLGDGWEDRTVHNHSIDTHNKALKMGTNIILYYLTH